MASKKNSEEPMHYEKALSELEGIIRRLEEKEIPLEALTKALDRAGLLIQFCKKSLLEADVSVQKALKKLDQ